MNLILLALLIIVGLALIRLAIYLVQPDEGFYDLETDVMALLDDINERR